MGRIPHLVVYAPVVAVGDLALIHTSLLGVPFTPFTPVAPCIGVLSLIIL
jgi:hypothetical protein